MVSEKNTTLQFLNARNTGEKTFSVNNSKPILSIDRQFTAFPGVRK